jgi:mxaJ protein
LPSTVGVGLAQRPDAGARVLRVCADLNNLPFSNERREGFENRLAELVARDLGARLEYVWWAQRRGFIRNTLAAGECDVVFGVPSRFERVLPTAPYLRSSYVFVSRDTLAPPLTSLDDQRLRTLRIGVHLIGDDYTNTPPAHALARRGIVRNVAGYTIYGDYREPNPPARIIEALGRGEIDVARPSPFSSTSPWACDTATIRCAAISMPCSPGGRGRSGGSWRHTACR